VRDNPGETILPKTLLAVDDSATMRKVLEITFAGEDFRVITADGASSAIGKLSEEPVAIVLDTSLPDGADSYALAREIRSRDGRAAILLLSSRYAPYDAARGKEAGVDDFIDKPFDSQAIIDKVKKALVAREAAKAAPVVAPVVNLPVTAPAPPAVAATVPHAAPPFAAPRAPVVSAPAGMRPSFPTQRTHTLSFEGAPGSPSSGPAPSPPVHAVPAITRTAPLAPSVPVVHVPPVALPSHAVAPPPTQPILGSPPRAPDAPRRAPEPIPVAAAPVVAPVAAPLPAPVAAPVVAPLAAAAVNGHLAGKLGELGLTAGQIEAVLALSREVVERVVWEVVPQLAEALIKEEIVRITKEG
jgi:CheY-like chemotaxis protein